MKEIDFPGFRASPSSVFKVVKRTGKPVIVTRQGKPLVMIQPPSRQKKYPAGT
jgi:prevent-host-death family protein